MNNDIQKSFSYLHTNIPQWFDNVAEIEQKMVALQSELSKIPVSRSLPLKKRTGSMESIRDLDAIREDTRPAETQAHQIEPTTRKRKEPSLLSGQQSGPSKLRSRTMIVVNYDGQIQSAFEQLVRAIGTGRNMLRKAKMAAKLEAMAALAGSSDDDDDDEDDSHAIMSKIGYRHRSGLPSLRARGMVRMPETSGTPIERFDTADKALEEAQALCERAAHQSLREGDCRKELEGIRRHFTHVVDIAKDEVARHPAQTRAADEKEQLTAAPQPEKHTTVSIPDIKKDLIPTTVSIPDVKKDPIPTVITPAIPYNPTSKVYDIEIDDEDDDDDDAAYHNFVMPPVRLTSRV